MEKNFEKYGVAHYMGNYITSLASAISVLRTALSEKHADILETPISPSFPNYDIQDLLGLMTDELKDLGEIIRETDTFLLYKKDEEYDCDYCKAPKNCEDMSEYCDFRCYKKSES